MSTQPHDISKGRGFEFVTKGEFQNMPSSKHTVYLDVEEAIGQMKSQAAGEGTRIKLYGTHAENNNKRKAAYAAAMRRNIPVETFVRGGYLWLRKLKEWK